MYSALAVNGTNSHAVWEREAGVFQRMRRAGLLTYGELRALFWYGTRRGATRDKLLRTRY
jgi:hypothetical protein